MGPSVESLWPLLPGINECVHHSTPLCLEDWAEGQPAACPRMPPYPPPKHAEGPCTLQPLRPQAKDKPWVFPGFSKWNCLSSNLAFTLEAIPKCINHKHLPGIRERGTEPPWQELWLPWSKMCSPEWLGWQAARGISSQIPHAAPTSPALAPLAK